MKHQKTTVGGIVGGLLAILTGVQFLVNGQRGEGVTAIGSGLGILYGLWQAKDRPKAAPDQAEPDQAQQ